MSDVKRLRMQRRASIHHDGWEYIDCVRASDYDALAAENAKLREALTEAQAALYGAREVCGSIGNIQHAIDLAATALQPSGERT